MKIDEALYQLKQNIKMHEIEGTTSNQNEREKVLLDYITNLQEEKNKYKKELDEAKYHLCLYSSEETMLKQIEDYKSRNKKAIEYIERAKYVTETMEGEEFYKNYEYSMEDLLDILQGEDNTPENLYRYTPEKGFRLVGDDNER